ncbi:PepSY domain-containing protein [Ancylomarina sp. 16SWW S1-10-2]|uniref:PepSY-associated TM helix domain-containing protein n=1 Tax=Ancylomarina sp. 16SWW S1-10-2 TaxID=2499681 RepID=UPI00189CB0C9|nr:PepSY-associated TM helix domain-containing protein [Ancylomarina sp. 16SWW S1-10-2]
MLKYIAHKIHLIIGLTTGLVIFIICITGSIYTFKKEIQDAMPYVSVKAANKSKLELSTLVAKFNTYSDFPIIRIYDYQSPNKSVRIMSSKQGEKQITYIDPYTGKIIKDYKDKSNFWSIILGLHRHLLLPKPLGKLIIGYSVILFTISLLTGFILWFPKKIRMLKEKAFRNIKFSLKGKAQTFRLHSNMGLYVIIPLLISCTTGLVWTFPKYEKAVYRLISPDYKKNKQKPSEYIGNFQLCSLDKLKKSIDSQNPKELGLNIFFIPQKSNSPIRVLSCIDDDKFGFTNNYLADPSTGEILYTILDSDKNRAEKLKSLNYDIHTGSIGGIYGKLVVFILGLLGASLPVSGYLLFFKKRYSQIK